MANLSTKTVDFLKFVTGLSMEEKLELFRTLSDNILEDESFLLKDYNDVTKEQSLVCEYLGIRKVFKIWREQWTTLAGKELSENHFICLKWWLMKKVMSTFKLADDFWICMRLKYPLLKYKAFDTLKVTYLCLGCSTIYKESILDHIEVGHKCENMTIPALLSRSPVATFPLFPPRVGTTFLCSEFATKDNSVFDQREQFVSVVSPVIRTTRNTSTSSSRGVTKKSIVRKRNLSVPVTTIGVKLNEEEEAVRILHGMNN